MKKILLLLFVVLFITGCAKLSVVNNPYPGGGGVFYDTNDEPIIVDSP
jgi:uncharacterized protein YceK